MAGGCVPSFVAPWRAGQTDQIVGREVVELTQLDQIVNFELGSSGFNMAIALPRLVQYFSDPCLGIISVLANAADDIPIIHVALLNGISKKYYAQSLSIEYNETGAIAVQRCHYLDYRSSGIFSSASICRAEQSPEESPTVRSSRGLHGSAFHRRIVLALCAVE